MTRIETLLARSQAGDTEAKELLVKENAGLILREKREELKKMLDYKIDEAISLILESEPEFHSSKEF